MIEEFSFGNFWSFKELQTLNMGAAKIKSKNALLDEKNVIPLGGEFNLLKSKAIYGANASGKSNLIQALVTFIRIIKDSVKEENVLSLINSFKLSMETITEPTFFQLVFRINKTRYRYGFEADPFSIKSEWLFSTPRIREQTLFIREEGEIIDISKKHFEEGCRLITLMSDFDKNPIFREDSLFLSSLATFGFGKISRKIIDAITSISVISGLGQSGLFGFAGDALEDKSTKAFMIDLLKISDFGINDLKTREATKKELPDNMKEEIKSDYKKKKIVTASHSLFNSKKNIAATVEFDLGAEESEGTKKMFELSPFIYKSLKEGRTLVIDEFDSRFHPLLTKQIVELFNSSKNRNAQLIFTTHDTNLLSSNLLRRDQIDFVEKDQFGASHLYTLIEIKGVRNNASFEKDYIQGKYGAIPFLGDYSNLF